MGTFTPAAINAHFYLKMAVDMSREAKIGPLAVKAGLTGTGLFAVNLDAKENGIPGTDIALSFEVVVKPLLVLFDGKVRWEPLLEMSLTLYWKVREYNPQRDCL